MAKKKDVEYEEVKNEVEYWTPENVGDSIVGILSRTYDGTFGKQYVLETEGQDTVLPSHAILSGLMSKVPIGVFVRVVYEGVTPSKKVGQSPTKQYKVFTAKQPA